MAQVGPPGRQPKANVDRVTMVWVEASLLNGPGQSIQFRHNPGPGAQKRKLYMDWSQELGSTI